MLDSRKISAATVFFAVMLMVITVIMPLMSTKASANTAKLYGGVMTGSSGEYSAALLDNDFYDSMNGCLTQTQESQLLDLMIQTADKIGCNIGIVITSDLGGMSDTRYADSFGDTQFGVGSSYAVLLLLNTHDNPSYKNYTDRISTSGLGRNYFDKKIDKIFDKTYDGLDTSGFYAACRNFCGALQSYKSSGGYSGSGSFSLHIDFTVVVSAFVIGVIASVIVTSSVIRGYKRKTPISAVHYIDKSRTRIIRQEDRFVREHTTSVHISSSSGGGGGHHGGGGGSHRSGGHGGGGGRHR